MTLNEKHLRDRDLRPQGTAPEGTGVYDPVEEAHLTVEEMRERLVDGHKFVHRVGVLSEVALQIDAAGSQEEILEILGGNVVWLMEEDHSRHCAFVALRDATRNGYTVSTLPSLIHGAALDGRKFSLNDGVAGSVMTTGTIVSQSLAEWSPGHPEMEGALLGLEMEHILATPMKTGDDTIGVLVVATADPKPFQATDIWIMKLISLHAAIAIKNHRLLEEARKRMTQIELVNEMAEKFTSTLELEQLLSSAAERIRSTFEYFDVTIFMVEEEADEAVLVAHAGNHLDFLPHGYRQPLSSGIVGWVARHGENVVSNNVSRDPRYLAYEYHNTQSELTVPIRIEGKVVGVVNVEDTQLDAFDETDAIVLETVCDQLGGMINNAKLYDQLLKTNATLTDLDRMKSDFLGIVSHDFRTPLASVILAAKSMVKHGVSMEESRRNEYLRIIVDQAEKLKALAEDTLSITRHESGSLSYHYELVNVERMIKDAVNLVQFSRRHSIDQHVDTNVAYVKADQMKLRQLIHNLLSNAVKYSPRGGKISVRAEQHSVGNVLFSVSDEGIGIPETQQSRLFKKFSRVDSPEAREIKGSGLGLWICHEIVKGHGGDIWVESEPGKGSTFKFTMKAEQVGDQGPD
ncbi:MAG: ATP-binding protein [Ignavibacteria bacterium]|nr:ATP-binding protein [Ignavibacteria bacterium]